MGAITERKAKDGSKSYCVRIRRRGMPTICKTFKRKTDAAKFIRQVELKIDEGKLLITNEATKHTLADAIDRYIEQVMPDKPRSQERQTGQLNWWRDQIGHLTLAQVSPAVISEQRDILKQGITPRGKPRSNATINRYLAALSHMYTIAIKEWGITDNNPVLKVRKLKEPRGRVRYLDNDERERLINACKDSPNEHLYVIVMLTLATGARRNEIIGLKHSDINMEKQLLIFQDTKNGTTRSVPVTGLAYELLKEHLKVRTLNTDLVFPSRRNINKPIDIRKSWDKAIRKAGIKDFRYHDLRHTSASYLAMNGASIAEIANILGHKSYSMVKRYSHFAESHLHGVLDNMNKKIFK